MSHRKAKSSPKLVETNPESLRNIVLYTMNKIATAVGSSLGPSGKLTLIESDIPGIPNRPTKDGVTIFRSLGAVDPFEHLIMESARDVAQKTATEAGDGTTTATVLANAIIRELFTFCAANPKHSPQKAVRQISKVVRDTLIPYIRSRSIKIGEENKDLLKMVAKISANGDDEMADAVIKAFEEIGYGDASHVTIRQVSGPHGYKVERIDGFPVPKGYEESTGKLHPAFINDQSNLRCYMEKPLFLLYDGILSDLVTVEHLFNQVGDLYMQGNADFKNIVIFANGFSDNVITTLAFNFQNPSTINILPMVTPIDQFINSQTQFLYDLSAFTGAKVFGLKDQVGNATIKQMGYGMEHFECYRFRSTVIGNPDPTNVEVRADELKKMKESAESQAEKVFLEERIGKITNGIAKLTIYGGSGGELKEAADRVEDAVCSVRSSISHGALPGGCRIAIDMTHKLAQELKEGDPAREVLMPALMSLPTTLLDNAGYTDSEIKDIIGKLITDKTIVYDVENQVYGKAEELGLFDATKAVEESLNNATSIAGVLGILGGIVCHPRDDVFERAEARADADFGRAVDSPEQFQNEANERV